MTNVACKADAFITLDVDVLEGRTMVTAFLRDPAKPDVLRQSSQCLRNDAQLMQYLPRVLAEIRAEAALGRFETPAEQKARLAGYSSSGSATTETTSLNATCTSLGPSTGPLSFI